MEIIWILSYSNESEDGIITLQTQRKLNLNSSAKWLVKMPVILNELFE